MTSRKPGVFLMLILIALNSALVIYIFYSQQDGYEIWTDIPEYAHDQSNKLPDYGKLKTLENKYIPPEIALFTEIIDRPLFVAGRLPPEEPTDITKMVKVKAKLELDLEGVAITPDKKVAILRDTKTKQLFILTAGAVHQGWTVGEIRTDEVVMERGDEVHSLFLEIDLKPQNKKRRIGPKVPNPLILPKSPQQKLRRPQT